MQSAAPHPYPSPPGERGRGEGERLSLANVPAPAPLVADEPLARAFSLERAAQALDTSALHWQKTRKCAACHTMAPYLMARPALAAVSPEPPEVRRFFEEITTTPEKAFPSHLPADARTSVVVGVGTSLAFNDRTTTGKLHPVTRKALDRMWAAQRTDGGWDWPFRDVPPIKDTEHYGVTFAALGVGLAPEEYAKSEPARKGLDGIRKYLKAHAPTTLHERTMLLWVAQSVEGVLTEKERAQTLKDLLEAQRTDGGWSMASLVENPKDPKRQTDAGRQARAAKNHGAEFLVFVGRSNVYKMPSTSDGYATGFALYVARQAGVPSADKRLRQGVAWLKSHQRVSGRWFTPSLGFHEQHLISNAGTAYAVLALQACGEVPAPQHEHSGGKKSTPADGELYNDPLPKGALARLGTTRFRLGNSIYAMALSPDGQTAVAVAGAPQTQFWDVATGKAVRRIESKEGGGGRVVAYSPDGRLVASVQDYRGLRLWDAATGKQLAELELGFTFTASLGFSPDSTVLAVGGGQATYGDATKSKSNSVITLCQWDGTSLKPLWENKPDQQAPLGPRSHGIKSLAFSPDGKHLVTGGVSNSIIRVWDAAGGKEIRQFTASGTQVGALAFAPIARAVASGSDDGGLTLWDPASGTKQWETKQPGEVRALAFAPDGRTLVAGGGPEYGWTAGKENDPFLVMVDASSGKDARPLGISRDSVASVAFSKDGKVLAAGLGGTLRFWHGTTGKERFAADGHENWISAVAVTEDGQMAVTAGGDGLLILWDLASGKEKLRLKGHQSQVRAAAFVPGGKLLASASTDQSVRLWDRATGQEVRLLKASPDGLLYSLTISPDGKLLAAGDYHNGSVFVWDLATGQLLHRTRIEEQLGHGVMCLAFSPDGRTLAAGETVLNAKRGAPAKSRIFLWDALTGSKPRAFSAHAYAVNSMAFSADGTMLASTGWSDKTIDFWDVASGTKLFDLPCGSGNSVAAFSHDGKMLACGGSPQEGISLWEVSSKKLRQKFSGHIASLHSLAFSPDGKTLVSGSMDTTGLIWDVTGLGAGAKTPTALSADKLLELWKSLASPDAEESGRVIWSFGADPKKSIPFIMERLRGLPSTDPERIRKLIAELDSEIFTTRQAAQKHLEALGKRAEPALRTALAQRPSLELSRRIESVLAKRETLILTPELLQVLRGIEVLEHVGSSEARQALDEFARKTPEDYFKQEARAAIKRLIRRSSH